MSSLRGTGAPNVVIWGGPGVDSRLRAGRRGCHGSATSARRSRASSRRRTPRTWSWSQFAAGKGADEAIMSNTYGYLCEGTAIKHLHREARRGGDPAAVFWLSRGHYQGARSRMGSEHRNASARRGARRAGDVRARRGHARRGLRGGDVVDSRGFSRSSGLTVSMSPGGRCSTKLSDLYELHADVENDPPPARTRDAV